MPLLKQHVAEGHLLPVARLIGGGAVTENRWVPCPTIAPPNWTTIATGADACTHQVTDLWVQVPGKTAGRASSAQDCSGERMKAEFEREAAGRAGLKAIFLDLTRR